MQKKIIFGAFCLAVAGMSVVSINYFCNKKVLVSELTLQNVEALSQDDTSLSVEEQQRRSLCYSKNGYWDMASVCEDGKVEYVTCTYSGELVIAGFTVIKGSYQKGKRYPIAWARYKCVTSKGNCCTEQGIYVDGKKVT